MVDSVRDLLVAAGVVDIDSVSGSVAGSGHTHDLAGSHVVRREGLAADPLGSLDDGGSQAHLDVPLDVAVEQEHTGVGSLEAENSIRVGVDVHNIAESGEGVVASAAARPDTRVGLGALEQLEVVTVQVEGVNSSIDVVDDNVDNLAVRDNLRENVAVDNRISVGLADSSSSVQSRSVRHDEGLVVEAGAGVVVLVLAEGEVKSDDLVGRGEDGVANNIVRLDGRVVLRAPLVDGVGGEGLGGVHDKLSRVVLGPDRGDLVVTVDVEVDQDRVVAVVTVNGRDEHVVALSGRKTDLVGLGLGGVGTIRCDDLHGVRVELNHGRGKGGIADHAEAVGLALDKGKVCVLPVVDNDAVREGRQESVIGRREHGANQWESLRVIPRINRQLAAYLMIGEKVKGKLTSPTPRR